MVPTYEEELATALAAVRSAMGVCQTVQAKLITADTLTKKDKSPVTVADFASQAVVCAALTQAFASDPIVGEEAAKDLTSDDQRTLREAVIAAARTALPGGTSDDEVMSYIDRGCAEGSTRRYWTLDPIDGTKGFLRGGQYAVALALIVDHEVVLGVLGCPNVETSGQRGTIFHAVHGRGACMISAATVAKYIQVSRDANPASARLCESVESSHSDQSLSQKIATSLGIESQPLRMDSQVKYGILARGEASIYLRLPVRADYREKVWDHAAGMIIVEEAGGTVTDITGKPLDFSHGRTLSANRGIVASSGLIHDAVLRAVSDAGAFQLPA